MDEDASEALNMGLEWAESDDPRKRASADGLIDLGLKKIRPKFFWQKNRVFLLGYLATLISRARRGV